MKPGWKQACGAGAAICCMAAASAAVEHSVQGGCRLEYVRYEEPDVMSEEGVLAGISAGYRAGFGKGLFCRIGGSYSAGTLHYSTDASRRMRLRADTPNQILDVRGETGLLWPRNEWTFGPYAGVGYRFLVDDLPSINNLEGYRREQAYLYLPLGLEAGLSAWALWKVSGRLEYDLFIEGRNRSIGEKMKQEAGYGVRCSVAADYVREFAWFRGGRVETFVQYWSVKESTLSAGGFYEPENSSIIFGLSVAGEF